MTAFEDVNGVPATGNRYLLTEILRNQFGFKGFVVSDAGAVEELIPHGYADGDKDAVLKGFGAGCDMLMHGDLYNDHLPALIEEGKITMEQVDASVLSILTMKYLVNLIDEPYVEENPDECFFCEEHVKVAYESGIECPVLLENNGILPLSGDIKTIALIGPLATEDEDSRSHVLGRWRCLADPGKTVTLPDALKRVLPHTEIKNVKGCTPEGKPVDKKAAIKAASESDVIVAVMGEDADWTGEAASRSDIALPQGQRDLINALIETGKPVVLLVSSGRPIILTEFKDRVAALMMTWQLGTAWGDCLADILTGIVSPSGHLSTSFPVSVGQLPVYYNYHNTGRPVLGKWRFEARYMDCQAEPLYPFGYGKSYTEFAYEDITLSDNEMTEKGHIDVTLTVKNIGKHDGAAVVQLYIRDLIGCRVRPVKELKGFEKVWLKAGESKEVTLRLNASDLAFHDSDMNCIVEPGKFKLWIAEHALDNSREFDFSII